MKLPIDVSGLTFLLMGAAAPVRDYETKQAKGDDNGVPLYQVPIGVMGADTPELITVKVPGEPSGLALGQPVRLSGLVAQPWAMGDRNGVSFRASRITAAHAAAGKEG